jgi:hypothetical protein
MGIRNKTMKGYEYVHYMTLEEWKKWEENVISIRHKKRIKFLLNDNYSSFNYFISRSFVWFSSNENYIYWLEISKRIAPLADYREKVKLPNK